MDIQETLVQLKTEVFARQSVLAEVYKKHRDISLARYSENWPVIKGKRSAVFAKYLLGHMEEMYGPEIASAVVTQFTSQNLVSTVDHHGLLNHPFFINSNVIYSLKKPKFLLCLPTSGVSLNNNTSWSACLMVHDEQDCLTRFSFYPDRLKTQAVFSTEAIRKEQVHGVLNQFVNSHLSDKSKNKLGELVKNIFDNEHFYSLPSFSAQAAFASTHLWRRIFPSAPEIVYVPLEELVTSIIIGEISHDPQGVLHQLLFISRGWDTIGKYFQGSLGAFTNSHKGSFLYWAVNKKERRIHLIREGKKLIGHGFEVNSGVEEICQGLEHKTLYPTSLTCFLVLLHYGVTCLGGFNQVNWLTAIKGNYLHALKELGYEEEIDSIERIVTDNFAESNLAFGVKGDVLYKPTGMDLFLSGKDWYPAYHNLGQQLTVGESIDSLMPEIYKVITPVGQQKKEFLSLTEAQILQEVGALKKIRDILGS